MFKISREKKIEMKEEEEIRPQECNEEPVFCCISIENCDTFMHLGKRSSIIS